MEPGDNETVPMAVVEKATPLVRQPRDFTPIVLGLLAVAAVLALGLSAVAVMRRGDSPTGPSAPASVETTTTIPVTQLPTTTLVPVTTTAAPNPVTRAPDPDRAPGKGKGNGGKDE